MAPRGIYYMYTNRPQPTGGTREMISPSLTFPENASVELLRERSRGLCCLSLSQSRLFSPSHARSTFDTRMGRSTRARFTSRKCGQRPVFFAFCCPFIDLDAIFVSRLRNMGRLHHAPKSLGMAKDKFPFHDCSLEKYSFDTFK